MIHYDPTTSCYRWALFVHIAFLVHRSWHPLKLLFSAPLLWSCRGAICLRVFGVANLCPSKCSSSPFQRNVAGGAFRIYFLGRHSEECIRIDSKILQSFRFRGLLGIESFLVDLVQLQRVYVTLLPVQFGCAIVNIFLTSLRWTETSAYLGFVKRFQDTSDQLCDKLFL